MGISFQIHLYAKASPYINLIPVFTYREHGKTNEEMDLKAMLYTSFAIQ